MKLQKLQIDKACFDAILKGEQKIEHRYIYPSNATRYVYYRCNGKGYKRQEDIPEKDELEYGVDVIPVAYDALYLINGRRKDARRLTVEVEKTEFVIFTDEDGKDCTFEENGKEYLACQVWYYLGKVISTENM